MNDDGGDDDDEGSYVNGSSYVTGAEPNTNEKGLLEPQLIYLSLHL